MVTKKSPPPTSTSRVVGHRGTCEGNLLAKDPLLLWVVLKLEFCCIEKNRSEESIGWTGMSTIMFVAEEGKLNLLSLLDMEDSKKDLLSLMAKEKSGNTSYPKELSEVWADRNKPTL